ncbi:MAG: hypothetical protein QXW42_04285 [Thermofilum sp.]
MGREIHYNPRTKTWSVYSTVVMDYVAKGFRSIGELIDWLTEDFKRYKENMESRGFKVAGSLPELRKRWRKEAIEARAKALMTARRGKSLYFPVHVFEIVGEGKLRYRGMDIREVR